jgi:hypothetical protein
VDILFLKLLQGASFLAGIDLKKQKGEDKDAKSLIVVDVGGTSTDVGVLLPSGFPRQAAAFIDGPFELILICIENLTLDPVAGVRTK